MSVLYYSMLWFDQETFMVLWGSIGNLVAMASFLWGSKFKPHLPTLPLYTYPKKEKFTYGFAYKHLGKSIT